MQGVGRQPRGGARASAPRSPAEPPPPPSVSQDARGCCPAPAPGLWLRSPIPTGAGGHAPRPPCLLQAQGRVSKWGGWGSFGRTLRVTFGSLGLGAGLGWSKASAFLDFCCYFCFDLFHPEPILQRNWCCLFLPRGKKTGALGNFSSWGFCLKAKITLEVAEKGCSPGGVGRFRRNEKRYELNRKPKVESKTLLFPQASRSPGWSRG